LGDGVPLDEELIDATALGVREPARMRLLCLASVPTPNDITLRTAAAAVQFLAPATHGLALRYGIFVRADCWRERELIAHELEHFKYFCSRRPKAIFSRVGWASCPPSDASCIAAFRALLSSFARDAQTGGRDAHPTRDSQPARGYRLSRRALGAGSDRRRQPS
jgi:hypothetical protein